MIPVEKIALFLSFSPLSLSLAAESEHRQREKRGKLETTALFLRQTIKKNAAAREQQKTAAPTGAIIIKQLKICKKSG
jgi:hypothetical protein